MGSEENRGVSRALITVLSTDIVGSTEHAMRLGDTGWRQVLDEHERVVRREVERAGGLVVQMIGDCSLSTFDGPARAIRCAETLVARARELGFQMRAGLHAGECELRGNDIAGIAVHIAARVSAKAGAGDVLVSRTVRDLVGGSGIVLQPWGEHELKGVPGTWELFVVGERATPMAVAEKGRESRGVDHRAWPNNLPEQLSSFVGREREREQVRAALESTRLLVLTGTGGVGKTRLARRVVGDCSESFADGAWWVELAPLGDGESMSGALAGVLDVRPLPGRTEVQAAVDRLGDDRALVVLDNCEHVLDATAELAEALLRGCPRVVVLATSRERLGVPGEVDWRVPSLSLPGLDELETSETVTGCDAGGLFVERAASMHPEFALTDENAPSVARICRELDGVPLAIELASARVRMMSVEQIADGLRDRFRMLTGGARGVLPRHRTLRASMDWSYDLLTVEERLLFRRLAVFAGGWSLDAVGSVCTGDGLDDWLILDLLASLVDKSLVVVEAHDRAPRYRMLETVSQYAMELLERSGELSPMRNHHLEFFAGLADQGAVELDLPRNRDWLDVLDAEAANLESAIDRALETDPDRALRMSVALTAWWEATGRFATAYSALDRALQAADPAPRPLRARALWNCGQFARYRRNPSADGLFQQAYEMAESVADEPTLARALRSQGMMRGLRDPAGGRPVLERAFELALSAGDASAMIWSTTSLAWCYLFTDDYGEAEHVLDRAGPAIEQAGVVGVSWAGFGRGWSALVRGEHERCFELLEESVSGARELGDPVNEAFAHMAMARMETMQGRADVALERQLKSEARLIAAGAAMALPLTRLEQASAYAALGRLKQAQELLEGVIAARPAEIWTECQALVTLGDVRRVLGDAGGSLACARDACAISERLGLRSLSAAGHELLARLAIDRGEWSEAEALAHEALAQRVEIGARVWLPQSLDPLAQVAAGLESYTEAARLLGAAQRARSDLGLVRWAPDEPAFDELERTLAGQLAADGYATARAEGAAMPLDQAIGWLRRARGARKRPSGGWESLTPTELQVVELVAQGLTNPQVAARMFVSRATVKVHLAHVFQKLDVRSRSELTAMVVRRAG